MKLFGSYNRKPFAQVKAHLVPKDAFSSSSSSVAFYATVFHYMTHKVVVLLHILLVLKNSSCMKTAVSKVEVTACSIKTLQLKVPFVWLQIEIRLPLCAP